MVKSGREWKRGWNRVEERAEESGREWKIVEESGSERKRVEESGR